MTRLRPRLPDGYGALAPDPDPIDHGGHGTHVADIIGGAAGVAPGVSLYAYQVCSAVTTSRSGVALIQAMEAAVDPNGDGDTGDHVDIIHMSLGSSFGQPFDDDLTVAVDNATTLGVLTVCSAGNSADHPYVTGTPGAARTALSTAQTAVPSAHLGLITVISPAAAAGDYIAVHQPWSGELAAPIEGPVLYGDGSGGNLDGCGAFAPGSIAGQIVFVDRGVCPKQSTLFNHGPGNAQNEAFTLIGISPNIPSGPLGAGAPTPDLRAVGVNTTPVPAGVCSASDSFVWSFAINTHERQTHLLPVINAVDIDVDRDGTFDFQIANVDMAFMQTGTSLNGIEITWATDLATDQSIGLFFTEHATNTAPTSASRMSTRSLRRTTSTSAAPATRSAAWC